MSTAHTWNFKTSFRRNAFGWAGTSKAIGRIKEALGEIERAARTDPALAADGAVLLLEKLSPALAHIDSSSGSLGSAAATAVSKLVPLISGARVPEALRRKWLDRLFEAYQDDDPPYIECLGEFWGDLCTTPALASDWADRLMPLVRLMLADRRSGVFAYAKAETLCLSALFKARRFDDLLELRSLDPKPGWQDQQWVAKVMVARGEVDAAIDFIEDLRSPYASDAALSALAEQVLLDAGRVEEAYTRYAIAACDANTHIATFRAIVKRYPGIAPARILTDLIASSPGTEGKWFATAKTIKQYDLALALAQRAAVDPNTLIRAARDHLKSQPDFAVKVALYALQWMARGAGYEITGSDVRAARDHALEAARELGQEAWARAQIAVGVAGDTNSAAWVRQQLLLG